MQKSDFQFTKPSLTGIDFQIHNEYVPAAEDEEIDMNLNVHVDVKEDKTVSNTAYVEVTVTVGATDGSTPFHLVASEGARFRWNPEVFDKNRVKALLHQNAAALLLSYLRPTISNITASSPFNRFDLPFINLT